MKIKVSRLEQKIFMFAWMLMIIHTVISGSYLSEYTTRYTTVFSIILFGLVFFINRIKLEERLLLLLIIIIGVIIYLNTTDNRFIWMGIALAASKNIDIKKIEDITYKTLLFLFISIGGSYLLLRCFNIIEVFSLNLRGGSGIGIGHPNMTHQYLAVILSIYICKHYRTITFAKLFITELLNGLLMVVTQSRSGFLSFTIVFIVACATLRFRNKKNYMRITACGMYGLVLFSSFAPIIFLKHKTWFLTLIDNMFSGRLQQARYYYSEYGIKLFGSYMKELYADVIHWYLDLGFARVLILDGVVVYVLFVLGYYLIVEKSIAEKDMQKFIMVITMMLLTISESMGTYIFFNFTLLYFGDLLFKERRQPFKNKQKFEKRKNQITGEKHELFNNFHAHI